MRLLTESWNPEIDICDPIGTIISDAKSYYYYRYNDFDGNISKTGLVAFIRHEYTNYEYFLFKIDNNKGKTVVSLLYLPLRTKVDNLILKYMKENNIHV